MPAAGCKSYHTLNQIDRGGIIYCLDSRYVARSSHGHVRAPKTREGLSCGAFRAPHMATRLCNRRAAACLCLRQQNSTATAEKEVGLGLGDVRPEKLGCCHQAIQTSLSIETGRHPRKRPILFLLFPLQNRSHGKLSTSCFAPQSPSSRARRCSPAPSPRRCVPCPPGIPAHRPRLAALGTFFFFLFFT